jgi:hypothetical protein
MAAAGRDACGDFKKSSLPGGLLSVGAIRGDERARENQRKSGE